MIERLNILEKRYNERVEDLGNPDRLSDYSKTLELSKEKGRLEPTITKYNEYKSLKEEIEGLKDITSDLKSYQITKADITVLGIYYDQPGCETFKHCYKPMTLTPDIPSNFTLEISGSDEK